MQENELYTVAVNGSYQELTQSCRKPESPSLQHRTMAEAWNVAISRFHGERSAVRYQEMY